MPHHHHPQGLDNAAAVGRWGGRTVDVRSARLQEKEELQELTPLLSPPPPPPPAPAPSPAGPRCGAAAAAAPLSSAHLPGRPGCCPPGPRLRLSPPLPPPPASAARLTFRSVPGRDRRAAGAGGGGGRRPRNRGWCGPGGRCGPSPGARVRGGGGRSRSPGARAGLAGERREAGRASAPGWSAGRGQLARAPQPP